VTRDDFVELLKETIGEWSEDNASLLAAALSYYAILSLLPLLILAVVVTAQIYDDPARDVIMSQVGRVLDPQVAVAMMRVLENARAPATGLAAGIFGAGVLLFAASGAFAQLSQALDIVWQVRPAGDRGLLATVRDRLLAFSFILVVGALFLLSVLVSAAISWANTLAGPLTPDFINVAPALNIALSLLVSTLLFAAIYKILPRVDIAWRDVWIGAGVTAVLFVVGKELIGLYLAYGNPGSATGAAGSLLVLMIFIYYSAQIFLLGAEFTKVYTRRIGSRVRVSSGAVQYHRVTGEEPSLRAVAATLPEEEVQVVPRSPRAGAPPGGSEGAPEPAEAAAQESRPLATVVAVALAFVVGLLVGARNR
jgi:membrane protein